MQNLYAMYLRKSQKDYEMEQLGEMETLARHEAILRELARKQGLQVGKIYKEIVSGESISERPQMLKLLEDVNARKWKGVLVVEVERFARGATKDQGIVAEAFKYSETLIVTPAKTYDPNNEFDEEYFEFGLFMSRREYKAIRRRMETGKIGSVKEGNYIGSLPPYGYDIVRVNKKERTLEPNHQAEVVKRIYHWFIYEGIGTSKIAKRLSQMGEPTLTGKKEWSRNTINGIIKNPLYIGKTRWNRRKTVKSIVNGRLVKSRPLNHDMELIDAKHPAIIGVEDWKRAQEIYKERRNTPTKIDQTLKNPLAGLVKCSVCGRNLTYVSQKGNRRARMVHPDNFQCKVKSAFYDDIIDAVIYGLNEHIEDFKIKMSNDSLRLEAQRQAELIESLEAQYKALERIKKDIFVYLEKQLYTQEEFIERKTEITEEMQLLKYTIDEEKEKEVAEVDYSEKIAYFRHLVLTLKDPDIKATTKNDLLKKVIQKIVYEKADKLTLNIFLN